jgi:hypothetical protein
MAPIPAKFLLVSKFTFSYSSKRFILMISLKNFAAKENIPQLPLAFNLYTCLFLNAVAFPCLAFLFAA